MNLKILVSILVLFGTIFTSCAPPSMTDLELNKDSKLYAGEGEFCENQYLKVECGDGLECMLISSKPTIIKACYKPGTILEDDLINRHIYDNENYIKSNNITRNKTTT